MNETLETTKLPAGHPVSIYLQEKELILTLMRELEETEPSQEPQKYYNIFNQLQTIERRFERKENQLFPFLEKRGWNGPSQGMWSFHDNLREQFRLLRKKIEAREYDQIKTNATFLISGISRLLLVEENTLFPNAMRILTEEDWIKVRAGEDEIGWMLAEIPTAFPEEEYIHPSKDFSKRKIKHSPDAAHYDEGYMTVEQVNLLLKTMPLDLTFVDEKLDSMF